MYDLSVKLELTNVMSTERNPELAEMRRRREDLKHRLRMVNRELLELTMEIDQLERMEAQGAKEIEIRDNR